MSNSWFDSPNSVGSWPSILQELSSNPELMEVNFPNSVGTVEVNRLDSGGGLRHEVVIKSGSGGEW